MDKNTRREVASVVRQLIASGHRKQAKLVMAAFERTALVTAEQVKGMMGVLAKNITSALEHDNKKALVDLFTAEKSGLNNIVAYLKTEQGKKDFLALPKSKK